MSCQTALIISTASNSTTTTTAEDPSHFYSHHLADPEQPFGPTTTDSGLGYFDDYLTELQRRMGEEMMANHSENDDGGEYGSQNEETTEDLLTRLQQKERDLLLAAELGKALLERNEELAKRQDGLSRNYAARVEVRHLNFTKNKQFSSKNENFPWKNEKFSMKKHNFSIKKKFSPKNKHFSIRLCQLNCLDLTKSELCHFKINKLEW